MAMANDSNSMGNSAISDVCKVLFTFLAHFYTVKIGVLICMPQNSTLGCSNGCHGNIGEGLGYPWKWICHGVSITR